MARQPVYRAYSIPKMGIDDWWMQVGWVFRHDDGKGYDLQPTLNIHQGDRVVLRPYVENEKEQEEANEKYRQKRRR